MIKNKEFKHDKMPIKYTTVGKNLKGTKFDLYHLNELAKPNLKKVRTILEKQRSKLDMLKAEIFVRLLLNKTVIPKVVKLKYFTQSKIFCKVGNPNEEKKINKICVTERNVKSLEKDIISLETYVETLKNKKSFFDNSNQIKRTKDQIPSLPFISPFKNQASKETPSLLGNCEILVYMPGYQTIIMTNDRCIDNLDTKKNSSYIQSNNILDVITNSNLLHKSNETPKKYLRTSKLLHFQNYKNIIVLRELTKDDTKFRKNLDIFIQVTNENFKKCYILRSLKTQEQFKDFFQTSIPKRLRIFNFKKSNDGFHIKILPSFKIKNVQPMQSFKRKSCPKSNVKSFVKVLRVILKSSESNQNNFILMNIEKNIQ